MALLKTGYLLASRGARRLPPSLRHSIAEAGGVTWYSLSRRQAASARRNYAAVLGVDPSDPAAARAARRAFRNYALMLEDFILIGTAGAEEVSERLSYVGRERIDQALEAGRGCVLALPHAGSWDVAGCVAAILGYRIVAVAERFPGSLDEAVVAGRERFGLKVIPLGRPALRLLEEALARNEVVALLCDIQHGGGGVDVRMFGRSVRMPGGPAALALKTGAPLIPVDIHRTPQGGYRAEVDEPVEAVPSGDRKRDVQELMQQVAARFEAFIRRHPESWYAFRPLLGEEDGLGSTA